MMVTIRVHKAWTSMAVQVSDRRPSPRVRVHRRRSLGIESRSNAVQVKRTIRGGIVTTIIIFGLLLIIGSVSIALAFLYIRRKNQRRRQFTYSLESTSDDWEPSGTGYHLFDNWTNNRHHTGNNIDNVIIDANEHMPIATNMTNR